MAKTNITKVDEKDIEKSEKNNVVMLKLDRPREIKFGHKALKQLSNLTGKKLQSFSMDDFDLEELEMVLYCGLLYDARLNNETLKLEDMEDLLDQAENFNTILVAMNQGFEKAFEETEKQKN